MDAEYAQRRIAELEVLLVAAHAELTAARTRIADLEVRVASLLEHANRNSRNSNKPPSSDPPGTHKPPGTDGAAKGRKRGGQPGHPGKTRSLVPPEQVDRFRNVFPEACGNCWEPLPHTRDENALRVQTAELPPVKPFITEYRVHTVRCPHCQHRTKAPMDKVPASPFGPRLCAVVALLTGVYHLSRRSTVQLLSDLCGLEISLGAVSAIEGRVSAAVAPAVEEARIKVEQARVRHADGTTWLNAGKLCALWTVATEAATVFKIVADGTRETLQALFGKARGILVSDRASALNFWAMNLRQVCWAHLLRKFVSFSERGGQAGTIGEELLSYVGIMFEYWDCVKRGTLTRSVFREQMVPLRQRFEAALERAAASGIADVAGSCANILAHRLALWTFVDRDDVEPTNNHAERELRAFVLWRKRCFGTQSERGARFAERVMTVTHTARKQHRNVLDFLVACVTSAGAPQSPSLFAPSAA